nr:MAG TPA: hypothetical protein [Caudoviricetes sp.]
MPLNIYRYKKETPLQAAYIQQQHKIITKSLSIIYKQ